MSYWYYEPSRPREVKNGLKARSKKGDIGTTWWSKKWIGLLESFNWSNRLERGRRYARKGQVINFRLLNGTIRANVQGSAPRPYEVEISIKPIRKKEWEGVINSISSQCLFVAKLLAGEMPEDIESAFSSSKTSLFPSKNEIRSRCSCPDSANPCKHIAAVHYILAEEFDRNPFMMFELRGMGKDGILTYFKGNVESSTQINETNVDSKGQTEEKLPPLENFIDNFWSPLKPLDGMEFSVKPPIVSAAVIKRLGEPPFWRISNTFIKDMEKRYERIGQMAISVALGSDRLGKTRKK